MFNTILYVLTNIHIIGSPVLIIFFFVIFFFFLLELGILTAHKFNVKHSYLNNLTRKNITLIHLTNTLNYLITRILVIKFI